MNIYFRCLESRIDKNNTLYGKFNFTSIPSGQGNTFANALRRSLFSDLSGLAITHFCITSNPGLGYEFATIPGLAESVLDFSLNLKKVVLTGRLTGALSTCYKMDKDTSSQSPEYQSLDLFGYPSPSCLRFPLVNSNPRSTKIDTLGCSFSPKVKDKMNGILPSFAKNNSKEIENKITPSITYNNPLPISLTPSGWSPLAKALKVHKGNRLGVAFGCVPQRGKKDGEPEANKRKAQIKDLQAKRSVQRILPKVSSYEGCTGHVLREDTQLLVVPPVSKSNTPGVIKGLRYAIQGLSKENQGKKGKVLHQENVTKKSTFGNLLGSPVKENKKYNVQNFSFGPPVVPIGFLKAKGPTILRACDLILPPGVRCVHPDQYLGTLAADSALSIKFLIAAGKGYIVQDETFYKSLSRAKLLLASRSSKSPVFSTSCEAKNLYPIKAKPRFPKASLSSFKARGSSSYLHSPRKLLNASNQTISERSEANIEDKPQMTATSTNKDRALDQGKKVKNLRYKCIDPINEFSGAIFTLHESELHNVAQKKSKQITKNRFAFKGILSQRSINQEPSLTRLNDNERLSKKQLIWGAQDKLHPVLPLDATFTPISKVNFQIDIDRNTEKSEETIVFEIWTNGSITPKRAIQESCLALAQDFYSLFSSVNGFSNLHSWWKRESFQFYPRQLS